MYRQKEKFLKPIPFHIAGSPYDLKKTEHISFLKGKKTHSIITVPDIPFVQSKAEARRTFGINVEDFVILAGAVNPQIKSKGFKELIESLHIFSQKIAASKKVTFIILGKYVFNYNLPDNFKIISPGFLDLNGLFSAYYACDVYVSPSIEDSGPMMVNYAIACGRPVVAFPVGIAVELVIHKETGWVAELKNCQSFAEGICWLYNCRDKELKQIEDNCKDHINTYNAHPWYEYILD